MFKYYISYQANERGTSGFGARYVTTSLPLDTEEAIEGLRQWLDQQAGRTHVLLWWTPVQPG